MYFQIANVNLNIKTWLVSYQIIDTDNDGIVCLAVMLNTYGQMSGNKRVRDVYDLLQQ